MLENTINISSYHRVYGYNNIISYYTKKSLIHGKLNFAAGHVNVQSSFTCKNKEFLRMYVKFDEI